MDLADLITMDVALAALLDVEAERRDAVEQGRRCSLLMRRYGWTVAEAASVPVSLLPLLLAE